VLPAVTFDEAIRRTLDRNPTIAEAATSIAQAEAILQQARAVTLPAVRIRVSAVHLNEAQGFEDQVFQPRTQMTAGPVVSAPILAPALWAARAQARDQIEVATRSTAEVRQQIGVAAAQAYLAVIEAQRQIVVEQHALDNAQAHLDFARRRFEGGAGSRLNMVRAAQVTSAAQGLLERAQLSLRQAQEALGVLMAERGPVDAAADPAFDMPALPDEAVWSAARPDLQTQQSIMRAAERVVRDSWKDVAPTADAAFEPLVVAPPGGFQPAQSWRFIVSFSQPLYLGGLQRAVTRQREVALDASRLALAELQIQARSEVRLAQVAIASRERMLAAAEETAAQAAEVLRITTTAFDLGATTNLDVIDAQRTARDTEAAAALARDAVQRARLDLLVALGLFPR
jgi:outer membrane protein TolC